MTQRGRPPKPAAAKRATGNPGKREVKDGLPQDTFPVNERVPPPEWVTAEAAAEWRRLVPSLLKTRVLAKTDLWALEAFCTAYARWKHYEALCQGGDRSGEIVETKTGHRQMSTERILANQAIKTMREMSAQLGLDPVSRARVTGEAQTEFDFGGEARPQDAAAPADPWDAWEAIH